MTEDEDVPDLWDWFDTIAEPMTDTIVHPSRHECLITQCVECGTRDCPSQNGLHYQTNGCPSCFLHFEEKKVEEKAEITSVETTLTANTTEPVHQSRPHIHIESKTNPMPTSAEIVPYGIATAPFNFDFNSDSESDSDSENKNLVASTTESSLPEHMRPQVSNTPTTAIDLQADSMATHTSEVSGVLRNRFLIIHRPSWDKFFEK